jgi:uncharacterized protein
MATATVAREATPCILPLEVHVFPHGGAHYAFDVRNYAILKLDAEGAAVLSRMHRLSLEALVAELEGEVPAPRVRAHYLRFLELIRDDILSVEPVPRPRRPPFNRMVLMLAGGCNMGCTYCFEKDVPIYQKPNLMTRERADEILEWFFRHHEGDQAHVQLYGGEALLNWPILQYVVERMEDWAQGKDVHFTKYLITNGTLLDAARIAYLKAHEVAIQVSVDGDAQTHNRFRVFKGGQPTMDRIRPNIEELSRQGANFNLRAVLTRQNRDPRAVTDGLRALAADRVSFEVVATDNADAQFTAEDWEVFNQGYRAFVASSYVSWAQLPDEMQAMIIRICERQRVFYGCGAGLSEVTIAPDGSIYECQRIYREPYSRIAEDRSPAALGSRLLTMVDDRPICRDCWARYLCGGGCMHQSHVGHGSDDPLPEYCTMERDLVEASIVKIEEIRAARPAADSTLPASAPGRPCTSGL